MELLKKINNCLKRIELLLGTVGLMVIFFLITVNIIRRYFMNSAWGWAGELNGFIYAWIAFISAAYSLGTDRHVRIAFVEQIFGMKASQVIRILTDIVAIVAFVWLIFPTANALSAMQLTAALRWPKGAVYSGLIVGYVLYIIHLSIQIMRRIHYLKTGVDSFGEYPSLKPEDQCAIGK